MIGQRVLRLTNGDLGDLAGSIHFFPSAAVDDWGAIHIQYYLGWWCDTGDPARWMYKVRLATISDFDLVHSDPGAVSTMDLTPYAFDLDDPSIHDTGVSPKIGDYINSIDTRGCQVIAGYIAPEDTTGPAAVLVSFALIPNSVCVPDAGCYANCDGSTTAPVLNVNDYLCFLERYAAGDSYANCDNSTTPPVLNVNDFSCFLQKYSAGCG